MLNTNDGAEWVSCFVLLAVLVFFGNGECALGGTLTSLYEPWHYHSKRNIVSLTLTFVYPLARDTNTTMTD
jgi:hypothetical protein